MIIVMVERKEPVTGPCEAYAWVEVHNGDLGAWPSHSDRLASMVVSRILTAFEPLVIMLWLSLRSPGVRDQVRTEKVLFTMMWQRLRLKNQMAEGSDIHALCTGV